MENEGREELVAREGGNEADTVTVDIVRGGGESEIIPRESAVRGSGGKEGRVIGDISHMG